MTADSPTKISPAILRRARRRDRAARWVIMLGGFAVIASVIAILLLIVGVTLPLFVPARISELARVPLPAELSPDEVLAVGADLAVGQDAATAHVLMRDGTFAFLDLAAQVVTGRETALAPAEDADRADQPEPGAAGTGRPHVVSFEQHSGSRYSLLWSDASLSLVEVRAATEVDAVGDRRTRYSLHELAAVPALEGPAPTRGIVRVAGAGSTTTVRLMPDGRVLAEREAVAENILGEKETTSQALAVDTTGLTTVTALTMDREGTKLYLGTATGQLARWVFDDEGETRTREIITAFRDHRAITALALVFGDVSLAVGDATGELSTWFPVRFDEKPRLTRIHTLAQHRGAVRTILPAQRHKSLLSLAEGGTLHLDHMTSQRHLAALHEPSAVRHVGLSPRGDAAIALNGQGELAAWRVHAPHPEVSWGALFGKVHYEGYDAPSYTWQTTGGDDFEPKLSLVPLFSGTLKGTVYAMFFAVPLALFGAVYTAHFTTPAFKAAIKPIVEIMAAIPSVVLGFLVALWMAPLVERWILAVFVGLVTVPAAFVGFLLIWQLVRRFHWAKRIENGYEFLALVPVLLAGVGLAAWLMPAVEAWLFGGDFRQWLYQSLGMRYDQRNCVVIAFGLGFAVIPIVFSIAEDSLSSVPHALTAASLALGASRWQTLWRVILPSASPGIFAGIMIGFGRGVGETMIVLMATGNTPILDWSPFNGMRTLSANIAVEIPEAPVGGTLYRVLFLCAVLLFVLTFTLNTAAELVRQRLRKRYGRL
jgi:phosphate transport system permease protein